MRTSGEGEAFVRVNASFISVGLLKRLAVAGIIITEISLLGMEK